MKVKNKRTMRIKRREKPWPKESIIRLISFIIVGLSTGVIVASFKKAIGLVAARIEDLFLKARGDIKLSLLVILIFILIASLIYYLSKKNPMINGSGIPIIYGMLDGKFKVDSPRTLLAKFVTSVLAIGSGLTLGREGPSVQIGGLVGDITHKLLKSKDDRTYYIGSAAGAGIAVAFNAPITGLLFTIEEIFQRTNRKVFLSAGISIFSAVIISDLIFGNNPALMNLPIIKQADFSMIFYIFLLGIVCGLSGVFFNKIVIGSKGFFAKIKINPYIKYLLPFIITAIVLLYNIELFSAGEGFIFLPLGEKSDLSRLVFLYFAKILLLALAFGNSIPGGSLVPLLVIGSLLGNIFATFLVNINLIDPSYILYFALLAMAGHFSAIVRAPITGIILVFEMSGGVFSYFLGLSIVSLIAYGTAEVLKSKPFYSHLYELMRKG
ncbi:MAG: ClC family H(+)/Cl(-) exchange transporter [Anaerococcus sp.]|nr:ClC family H(+)/Cl(-) exchange transporter [Anaerococcus sp.]